MIFLCGCSGKYMIKTYPADAKVYLKDFKTNEKKLVGQTPATINEDANAGDVFFLVLEKENYKPKEIMVKVNQGESLVVSATLDPLIGADADGNKMADADKKDDKPQPGQPKKDDPPKDWEKEIMDMKLRIALLENTTSFYKDALFSPRLAGGPGPADRDRRENVTSLIFQAQQGISGGKPQEALAKIDRALQLDEFSSQAWMIKGSIKYLMKDFEGAKLAWEQSLKLDPYNKNLFKYLNTVYKLLNQEPMPEDPAALRFPASTIDLNRRNKKSTN